MPGEGVGVTNKTTAGRIEDAQHDPIELGRIADELQGVPGAEAARLRLHAVILRTRAKTDSSAVVSLPAWLSDLGLPSIDGRPLHRYRLSDDGFARLERNLCARASSLRFAPGPILAASFVLWAAEWFRRRYDGKGLRWENLGKVLGFHAEPHEWRRLADLGLRHWRIPELRINGVRYRLAAIARQGGFPLAAIEGQGSGWAPRFLGNLVGRLLGETDQTLAVADELAAVLMELVPETWRNAEIRLVSAELAVEVVRLRSEAIEAGLTDGAQASDWLDLHREGWRDDLPIGISGAVGRALLDGLMRAPVLHGGAGAVRVDRRLSLSRVGRRESVALTMDGELRDEGGAAIARNLGDTWNRLRLAPSGNFAQYATGELATAEADDAGCWTARSSLARMVFDVPPEVAVSAELRGAGQRVGRPFVLPGGQAVTAAVRVYAIDPQADGKGDFVLLGVGSGGYRPAQLLVDLNADWECAAHGDGATVSTVPDGASRTRVLWAVEGGAIATSPRGDRYLVRAGQKADTRDRLILTGQEASVRVQMDESLPVFLGVPDLRLCEGRRDRAANPDELWWRPLGTRQWLVGVTAANVGGCEFAWRDSTTGHIRALAAAVILPVGFAVERRRGTEWTNVSVTGWEGRVEIDGGMRTSSGWRFPARGGARSTCTIRLLGSSAPLIFVVSLPHLAWIHEWSEGPMERDAQVSLSTIQRYVARTEGRCELLADLLDRNRRPVAQASTSWWVDGELPLSTIRDDIAALLRPHADLDAVVRLNFNDSQDNFWYVSEFDHVLEKAGRGWTPSRAVVDIESRIVGRALHAPAVERDFGPFGLAESLNHRPFQLPALYGDWIAYLRVADKVLSRPRFIRGYDMVNSPNTPLAKAMAVGEPDARREALYAVIDKGLSEPIEGRVVVRAVIDLAISLRGLPPSTFDVLQLIPERPLLAARMLYQAGPDELEAIMRLAEGLPLAWHLVPEKCWSAAEEAHASYLFDTIPDQPMVIAEIIGGRRKAIAEREPAIAGLLHQSLQQQPLVEAANAFLNRSDDRIQPVFNPLRPDHAAVLPHWLVDEGFWRALDAPVAAALSVKSRIVLTLPQITCIKNVARRHPRWFRDGFRSAILELR